MQAPFPASSIHTDSVRGHMQDLRDASWPARHPLPRVSSKQLQLGACGEISSKAHQYGPKLVNTLVSEEDTMLLMLQLES